MMGGWKNDNARRRKHDHDFRKAGAFPVGVPAGCSQGWKYERYVQRMRLPGVAVLGAARRP
jgi:hypothetical protein